MRVKSAKSASNLATAGMARNSALSAISHGRGRHDLPHRWPSRNFLNEVRIRSPRAPATMGAHHFDRVDGLFCGFRGAIRRVYNTRSAHRPNDEFHWANASRKPPWTRPAPLHRRAQNQCTNSWSTRHDGNVRDTFNESSNAFSGTFGENPPQFSTISWPTAAKKTSRTRQPPPIRLSIPKCPYQNPPCVKPARTH